MIFRKICQAGGCYLVLRGILWAYAWMFAGITIEETPLSLAIPMALINLGFVSGLGSLFIFFDPHKVIQNYYTSFHKLVEPRRERQSFAQRIGVGEDDSL